MGLAPEKKGSGAGDKFIIDMFQWNASVPCFILSIVSEDLVSDLFFFFCPCRQGMLVISSSFMPLLEHFTFQTAWMATQLVARDRE